MKPFIFFRRGFYIPYGIEVNGNFVSDKEGEIAGIINGDVQVKSKLTVEKNGVINGDVHVNDLTIKGRINGNIYCEGKVATLKDAVVSGNIFAAEVMIDKLSIVKGVFSHINPKSVNGIDAESVGTPNESAILIADKVLPEEPPQTWF